MPRRTDAVHSRPRIVWSDALPASFRRPSDGCATLRNAPHRLERGPASEVFFNGSCCRLLLPASRCGRRTGRRHFRPSVGDRRRHAQDWVRAHPASPASWSGVSMNTGRTRGSLSRSNTAAPSGSGVATSGVVSRAGAGTGFCDAGSAGGSSGAGNSCDRQRGRVLGSNPDVASGAGAGFSSGSWGMVRFTVAKCSASVPCAGTLLSCLPPMKPLAARPVVRGHWHPLPSRPMSVPTADPSMCRILSALPRLCAVWSSTDGEGALGALRRSARERGS